MKVVNLRDLITFQAIKSDELQKEFQTSVDEYIKWCEEDGIEPEKPFSGKIHVRTRSEIHKAVFEYSIRHGMTMNEVAEEALIAFIKKKPHNSELRA